MTGENMNRPWNALWLGNIQPNSGRLLVNRQFQEYDAPSAFTSRGADILKLRSLLRWAAYCPEEGFHEGNLSLHWPEHPPHFDNGIGPGWNRNVLCRLRPRCGSG